MTEAEKDKIATAANEAAKECKTPLYFGSGFLAGAEWMISEMQKHAKQKEKYNLKNLRNKFFKECVENGKVSLAPHDLFEWFKKNVI
jgi:hypothetical protein